MKYLVLLIMMTSCVTVVPVHTPVQTKDPPKRSEPTISQGNVQILKPLILKPIIIKPNVKRY
jgi:hypothetical protein